MSRKKNPVGKRNPLTKHRGVAISHFAGVARYRDPVTGEKVTVAQRAGGIAEARRRIDAALDRRGRYVANPRTAPMKSAETRTLHRAYEKLKREGPRRSSPEEHAIALSAIAQELRRRGWRPDVSDGRDMWALRSSDFDREARRTRLPNPSKRRIRKGARRRNPFYAPHGFVDPGHFQWELPKHLRGKLPNVFPEGTDLSIWEWDEEGKPYAIAFQAKGKKPLWHHRFSSPASRASHIAQTISARQSQLAAKEKRGEARRAYRHDFKVGDYFYTSWGYDQTNVDFYRVTKTSEKSVWVVPVYGKTAEAKRGADYVVPTEQVKRNAKPKRVTPRDGGFKIDGHYASKWKGKPVYATASGWGH